MWQQHGNRVPMGFGGQRPRESPCGSNTVTGFRWGSGANAPENLLFLAAEPPKKGEKAKILQQLVACKRIGFNNPAADQVFLNDLLQHLRRAGVIPDALGVNNRDRAVGADS